MKPSPGFLLLLLAAFPGFGVSSGCGETEEPEVVWQEENEPNDTVAQANPMGLYSYVTGSMAPGDTDTFRLDIPADFDGYKVTLAVTDGPGDCFTGVDPNLEVRDADGVTVLGRVEDSIENYCPELQFVPRPGADYYVLVGTAYTLSGAYTLSAFPGGTGTVSGRVEEPAAEVAEGSGAPGRGGLASAEVLAAPVDTVRAVPATGGHTNLPVVEGEVILRLAPGVPPAAVGSRLAARVGLPLAWLRPLLGGRYQLARFTLPRGLDGAARMAATRRLAARLQSLDEVVSATPDGLLQPVAVPDDEYFGEQWGLQAYPGIDAPDAWDLTAGSEGVVVAVVDTGDDATHPDLIAKSVPGFDFISDPENAGDWNGVDPDPDDSLGQSHGVHVAGIVAASTDNEVGVAGVGWNTRYMPLRVCGNYGCTFADVIEAMGYAAGLETVAGPGLTEARVDVINLSLGGGDRCPGPLQDVITAATYRGVVVVAAAGNEGEDASGFTPANCQDVIAVGATDASGGRAGFSNHGSTVDVYAPGDEILSTLYGGRYGLMSGTSMATPHVSGVVALIKAVSRDFFTSSVLDVLTASCPSAGCVAPVNAAAALALAVSEPSPSETLPPLILVQAVNLADPDSIFYTFARDGAFVIEGLTPGNYLVRAGTDPDGDFLLGEPSEWYGVYPQTFQVTDMGEDVAGVQITLSPLTSEP